MLTTLLWGLLATASAEFDPRSLSVEELLALPDSGREFFRFDSAELVIESSVSDGEHSVRLTVESERGLGTLLLFSPGGRLRSEIETTVPGEGSEIVLEAEVVDFGSLAAAWPEGRYLLLGTDGNAWLVARPSLSHASPPAPDLEYRLEGGRLIVHWRAPWMAAGYRVEVENESAGISLDYRLEPGVTHLDVALELLGGKGEIEVSVAAEGANGNLSERSVSFDLSP